MKKFKAKLRLAGIFLALAMAVCCAVAGITLASGTQSASAMTGTPVSVSELYGTGKFNSSALTSLYKAVGGASVDTYAKLSTKVGGGAINADDIYKLNGNKNVKVTFGGKTWTVTYVSKTKSGDVIATLWAENPTTATYTFSSNGWYSQYWGYDKTTGIPFNYYSNQYGSSWIRSSVMNIGSAYLKATDGSSGQKTDAQVTMATGTQSASNEWARFTMDSATNSVKAYLATPSEVAWQEDLFVPAVNSTHILQSEAYGTPSGGRWYEPTDNASDPRDLRNAPTRIQYSAWKDDPIWLPALSETGWNGVTGFWNTTESQRAYSNTTANTWLRSGYVTATYNAYYLLPSGGYGGGVVSNSFAVRPALHLNLKSAADSAAGSATTGKTVVKLPTIEEPKIYNGKEQTFEIQNFNYSLMTVSSSGDGSVLGTGATVKMTDVGTRTLTYTLRNTATHCWAGGSTSPVTLTAKVNKMTVSPVWSGGIEFTYSAADQAPTATVKDVNGSALTLAYDYKYSATAGGAKTATTAHKNAGYYEATAKFATAQTNYQLDTTASKREYTILQKQVQVSGSLTIKDKYYDGKKDADVNPAGLTLSGVVAADTANVKIVTPTAGSGYTAQFESAEVGSRYVEVTGLSLSGTAASNYKLVQTTMKSYAQIHPIPIKVAVTAGNKVYDGTNSVVLTAGAFSVGTLSSSINGTAADLATVLNTESATNGLTATVRGSFADKNVANGKTVNVTQTLLGGTNATHFDLVGISNTAAVTANITKADLTVNLTGHTTNKYTFTYGDNVSVPFAVTNPVAGETIKIILEYSGTYADGTTLAATTTPPTKAGTFTVTAKIDAADANASNYALKTGTGILTSATVEIKKATLTITANAHNTEYGTAPSAIGNSGVTYTGFVNGHTSASLSGTLAYDYMVKPASGNPTTAYAQYDGVTVAGTTEYLIIPKGLTHADYDIKFVGAPLTVEKHKVTISIGDGTSVYGASSLNMPTITSGALQASDETAANFKIKLVKDGVEYDPATVIATNVNALKAGVYEIVVEFTNGNYDVTYTGSQGTKGLYTVTKAALTVTAADTSLVYGSAVPTYTATATGAVTGDNATNLIAGLLFECAYTTSSAVTTAGSEYVLTPYGLNLNDYEVTYVSGKVTVTVKAINVTIDDKSGVYGDSFGTLTYTASGVINNDNLGIELEILKSDGTAASLTGTPAAGTYKIKQKAGTTANSNYKITFTNTDGEGEYVIAKKNLTVTADDFNIVYGGAIPTYTVNYYGFISGESESTAGIFGGTLAFACSYDPAATNNDKNADVYTITPSGLTSDNYNITFADGKLTVAKKNIIVSLENQTQVYSGTISVLLNDDGSGSYVASDIWKLASVSGNTLIAGDSLKITVKVPANVNAGAYPLLADDAQIKTDNPNYNVTVITAQYTITKATLAVVANDYLNTLVYGSVPSASAMSVTYGEDDGTGTIINGFVNGESASTPGAITAGNKYDFTYKLGMDVYDASGNQIEYEIVPKGWTSANYEIKYVAGKLTLKPKDITVKINDLSSIYGETVKNPNDKANWSAAAGAILAGDDLGLDLVIVEKGTANVVTSFDKGVYDIIANTAGGATGWTNKNYNVTFESAVRPSSDKGEYSISAAQLTVTANPHSIEYGTANGDIGDSGVTYSGWLGSDESNSSSLIAGFGTVTFSSPDYDSTVIGKREVGGTFTLVPDVSGLTDPDGNYTFVAGAAAKLTVEKRNLTVEIQDQTKQYDGKAYQSSDLNPVSYDNKFWVVSSAYGSGFASWDAGNEDLLGVTLSRGRPTETNAGVYVITGAIDGSVANSIAANYNVTFENGTFEVTPYEITVYWLLEADNTLKTDGSDYTAPAFDFTYDGDSHVPYAQYVDVSGNWASAPLTTSGARTNAGTTYQAEAYLPNSNNYKFKTAANDKCSFTIKPRTLTVQWLTKPAADGGTIITSPNVPSYDYRKGIEQGPVVNLTGMPSGITLAEGVDFAISGKRSAEGNGTVVLTIINPNYTAASADCKCNFKIEKATPTGLQWYDKANGGSQLNGTVSPYIYNGESQHPVIISGTNGSDTYSYALYKKDGSGNYVPVASAINAGEYRVIATPTSDNYKLDENTEFSGRVSFQISAKPVDLEWVNISGDETNGWYYNFNGSVQKPDARLIIDSTTRDYIGLSVTYSNSSSSAVGTGYTATVTLPSDGNYVIIDGSNNVYTKTITYEIKTNEITVKWDFGSSSWITDNNGEWTAAYNAQNIAAVLNKTASMNMTATNEGVKLEYNVYRVDGGRRVKVTDTTNLTDAGVYVLVVEFAASNDPAVIKNYSIKDGEKQLTIEKHNLTITPSNMEVTFGTQVSDYEVSQGSFVGFFVDSANGIDETSLINDITTQLSGKLYASKNGNSWLTSGYTTTTAPGSSLTITLTDNAAVIEWLNGILKNYNYTIAPNATIKVKAIEGDVKLTGETSVNGDWRYDGTAKLPTAAYKSGSGSGDWTSVDIELVDDPNYSPLVDGKAVNAGTYLVRIIAPNGVQLNNSTLTFQILKREINIGIEDRNYAYGEVTQSNYQSKLVWNYAPDTTYNKPMSGDELAISLDVNFGTNGFDNGNYAKAGSYRIVGSWDVATYGANYNVTFEGTQTASDGKNSEGLFEVEKATITVTKQGTQWFNEEGILQKGDYHFISLAAKDENGKYKFVNYSGWQDADVNIEYSADIYNRNQNTAPAPEDETNWSATLPSINRAGEWVVNYKINIANHEELRGQWFVLIKEEGEYVVIIFQKNYEITYGDELPENLAEELIDGGYVTVSGPLAVADLKRVATAFAFNGSKENVNSLTNVGKYSIYFELDSSVPANYEVIYKRSNADADSNENRYVINPRKLTVEWGETEFKYDGNVHMPENVKLNGWVNGESLELSGLEVGKTKTYSFADNGQNNITVSVNADEQYDFTSNGGHQLVVSIDNENYKLDIENAAKTISISMDGPLTVSDGLPSWLIWVIVAACAVFVLIIVILAVVIKKRKAAADNDGFYDSVDGE